MTTPTALVQKLWNYPPSLSNYTVTGCNPAAAGRDYVEQLTFILFLKMANEPTTQT
ncbi:MAG: hypothetical protein ACOYM3_04420 [Terrimicrobiaceae bacterium]